LARQSEAAIQLRDGLEGILIVGGNHGFCVPGNVVGGLGYGPGDFILSWEQEPQETEGLTATVESEV